MAETKSAFLSVLILQTLEPCAIIMGSGDKGIQPSLYKICGNRFKIPKQKDFESLNVSVAVGMILYEAMKQRMV